MSRVPVDLHAIAVDPRAAVHDAPVLRVEPSADDDHVPVNVCAGAEGNGGVDPDDATDDVAADRERAVEHGDVGVDALLRGNRAAARDAQGAGLVEDRRRGIGNVAGNDVQLRELYGNGGTGPLRVGERGDGEREQDQDQRHGGSGYEWSPRWSGTTRSVMLGATKPRTCHKFDRATAAGNSGRTADGFRPGVSRPHPG